MGLEAAYIPYIVAAVGAYGGAANAAHTARKQDRQLAKGIEDQGVKQQQAAEEVNALVNKRANSNQFEAKTNAQSQLMDTLRRNAAGKGAVSNVIGASDRYNSQVEQGNASVGDYGSQLGEQIAGVDATTRQAETEAMDSARTASSINEIQRQASGDNFVNQLRVKSITNNPYIDLASKLAQNVGMAGAMQGGFGKGAGNLAKVKGAGGNFVPSNYATDPFKAGVGAFNV